MRPFLSGDARTKRLVRVLEATGAWQLSVADYPVSYLNRLRYPGDHPAPRIHERGKSTTQLMLDSRRDR
jgi:hypothetical protein